MRTFGVTITDRGRERERERDEAAEWNTLQFSDEIGEVQSCFLYNSRPHSASPKGR